MSQKSENDRQAAQDAEARKQGEKQARNDAAGRGDQAAASERGGQHAVEQQHERQAYDSQNNPTEGPGRIDPDNKQPAQPRSLAEGGVHPKGETP